MSKEIAQTILSQLGGNKFIAMTGANTFSHGSNLGLGFLLFKLPRAKNAIKYVRIVLMPSDTYTMQFCKRDGSLIRELSDIYCDMLTLTFERVTGLYTSL